MQDNSNKPIKIKIGSENQMEALSDMSLIQTDFSQDIINLVHWLYWALREWNIVELLICFPI